MKIDTTKLVKISTYATEKKVSRTTVLNWVENGTCEMVEIDGVKFIKQD